MEYLAPAYGEVRFCGFFASAVPRGSGYARAAWHTALHRETRNHLPPSVYQPTPVDISCHRVQRLAHSCHRLHISSLIANFLLIPFSPSAQTLVDMSCGSGLFSRRFLKSGRFAGVIAADFRCNGHDTQSTVARRCKRSPGDQRSLLRIVCSVLHVPVELAY